jgi:hypothetical protein
MSEVNYAELRERLDRGDLTLAECRRHGWTHAGYGWASNPPPQFNAEQKAAYMDGYRKSKAGIFVSGREN